jgi:hypothetical protein
MQKWWSNRLEESCGRVGSQLAGEEGREAFEAGECVRGECLSWESESKWNVVGAREVFLRAFGRSSWLFPSAGNNRERSFTCQERGAGATRGE